MPGRFSDEEWGLAFSPTPQKNQMSEPPEEDPSLWESFRRRAFAATEGDWGATFGSETPAAIPEEVSTKIPSWLGGEVSQAALHALGGVQGLLVDAPVRKAMGLPTSATDFRASDLAQNNPLLNPLGFFGQGKEDTALYVEAVQAAKAGDMERARELLQQYRTAGGILGGASRTAAEGLLDPTNLVATGPKLGAALLPAMAEQGVRAASAWGEQVGESGLTPERISEIPQTAFALGMPALAAKGQIENFRSSGKISKPSTQAAVEGAKLDNPYTSLLSQLEPEQGLLPPPGEGFRDVTLGDETPLTPQAGYVVRDLANKSLALANMELASGRLKEAGGQLGEPAPSPIQQVVVLDRNEVPHPQTGEPFPIEGNAAAIGDTIYITKRGALTLLQAEDAAGIGARINALVAHEVGHFQDQAMPPVQAGPLGEPLPPGARPTEAGHAPGGLYDDTVKDLNQNWLEHSLAEALNQNPRLHAEWGNLNTEGLFQPPTDVSPTAGTYQPEVLNLAALTQGRQLPPDVEAARGPEAMTPPPQVPQAGALKNLYNKVLGRVEATPEAMEAAGFKDPRFLAALLADKAKGMTPPRAPQVGDVIKAPPRPGSFEFPAKPQLPYLGPKAAALLGRKVPVPSALKQEVQKGSPLEKYLLSLKHPRKGRIAATGRVDWMKTADQVIELGKSIKGATAPVAAWRSKGYEVADFKNLLNNLRVLRTYAKDQGNMTRWGELDAKLKELETVIQPRLWGGNLRAKRMAEGTATPRQIRAQMMMQEHGIRSELSSTERRLERAAQLEASSQVKATDTYKAFRKLVQDQVKLLKEGDYEKWQRLQGELPDLLKKLNSELQYLEPGQRKDINTQTRGLIKSAQNAWEKFFGERKTAEEAKARQAEEEDYFKQAGAKRKVHERTKTTAGKVVTPAAQPKPKVPWTPKMKAFPSLKELLAGFKKGAALRKGAKPTAAGSPTMVAAEALKGEAPSYVRELRKTPEEYAALVKRRAILGKEKPSAETLQANEALKTQPVSPEERIRNREATLTKLKAKRKARAEAKAAERKAEYEARPLPKRKKPASPYQGEKLEQLEASEVEKAKALKAALANASKVALDEAKWSEGEGLTVQGKPAGKGAKVKVGPKEYTRASWLSKISAALTSEDPHASFASMIRTDDSAWLALEGYIRNRVLKPGGPRFDEETLTRFGFTAPTREMIRRTWKIVNAEDSLRERMGFDLSKLDRSPEGKLAEFIGAVRQNIISRNTVAYKYFGPDIEGKPTSRLGRYLDQLSKDIPGKGSLKGLVAKTLAKGEKPFISKELTKPSAPAFLAERKGPWGGKKTTHTYALKWTKGKGALKETLLPLESAVKAAEAKLGVTFEDATKEALKTSASTPSGSGKRKLYSPTELVKSLPKDFAASLDAAVQKRFEAIRGRKLESSRAERSLLLKKGDEFVYPSVQGEGERTGVPESLSPYGPRQVSLRAKRGRRGMVKTEIEAMLDKQAKGPNQGLAVFKKSSAPRGTKSETGVVRGLLSKPFFKKERLLSIPEVKLQSERNVARKLASFEEMRDAPAYRKALRKHVESTTQDFRDTLDAIITTAGIKKNLAGKGKLWTKKALYELQVKDKGAEWEKSHPYSSFRPEDYMNPFSEKLDEFIGERQEVALNERSAQLEGEYYYDEEGVRASRRAAEAKARKDFEDELLSSKEKFEDLALAAGESKAEEAALASEAGEELRASTRKYLEEIGGAKTLWSPDLSKIRKRVEAKVALGEIPKDEAGEVIQRIKASGEAIQAEAIKKPPEGWHLKGLRKEVEEIARAHALEDEAYAEAHGWKDYDPTEGDFAQAGGKRKVKPIFTGTPAEQFDALHSKFTSQGYKKSLRWKSPTQKKASRLFHGLGEAINITRPLKTAFDLSNPFRNTWQLSTDQLSRDMARWSKAVVGKKEVVETSLRRNLVEMVKNFGTEEYYKKATKAMEEDPFFQLASEAGVRFINENAPHEGFIGKDLLHTLIGKTGLVGKPLDWFIRGSERSYNYYQNKAMRDAYRYGLEFYDKAGLFDRIAKKGATIDEHLQVDAALKDLKDHINKAGSRAPLSADENLNKSIGYFLYSAQMNWSRLGMLGHAASGFKLYSTPEAKSYARRQVLRSLAGGIAGVSMVYSLAAASGEEPSIEVDPQSSDFMKVRFGPIAFDGWGGVQQWLRAGTQVISGKRKEISTGKHVAQSPKDTVVKFLRSKAGPGAQLVMDWMERRTAEGEAFDMQKDPAGFAAVAAKNLLLPMSLEDMGGIMRENPSLGFLIPLMLLGHGVSTSRGAKERWLGMNPLDPKVREAHAKTTRLEKELREFGVSGPKLSHKVSLPGQDVTGKRKYYNMTPGEVAQFEKEYMPLITDILVQAIESDRYQKLPREKKPKALQRMVHQLNIRYGAATRLKKKYAEQYKMGKIKPSNVVGSEIRDLAEAEEAEFASRSKGERF